MFAFIIDCPCLLVLDSAKTVQRQFSLLNDNNGCLRPTMAGRIHAAFGLLAVVME